MLKRQLSRSASICDGFRQLHFTRLGRGFLPLLAVMLLAAPQLAFAQNSVLVTVNPRSLDIDEDHRGDPGTYTVVLDTAPEKNVTVKVIGVPTGTDVPFTSEFNEYPLRLYGEFIRTDFHGAIRRRRTPGTSLGR